MRAQPSLLQTIGLLLGLTLGAVQGCTTDDVGTCCRVLDEDNMDRIPVPPPPAGPDNTVGDSIRQDPAFDCSGLTCVAYQGTTAFCTRECQDAEDCPEGFTCQAVLQSDPGPGSNISPEDKFCVRDAHMCESFDP